MYGNAPGNLRCIQRMIRERRRGSRAVYTAQAEEETTISDNCAASSESVDSATSNSCDISTSKKSSRSNGSLTKLHSSSDEKVRSLSTASLALNASRWRNFWVRFVAGWIMIALFVGIMSLGHFSVLVLVFFLQITVFREVIAIAHLQSKERHLKWFRTISWYFLFATSYYLYGESFMYYCKEFFLVDSYLLPFSQHHRFISFVLYIFGFVVFVLNLRKGHYKFQFSQLAFTHMILLFVVFQSNFVLCNIFEGLFWFIFPVSLVICNDIMAYFFGFFFGRTRLIKLSPKKTWEGFWGALVSTIVFGFFLSEILAGIPYLVCPVNNISQNYFNFVPCKTINPVFVPRNYQLTPALSALATHVFRYRSPTIRMAPIQLHSIILSTFASVIGPFGGFFASGFKRAFKIKDFSDSIPGHGGITDRVDCQFLMGLFAYVYLSSFIKVVHTSVGQVLQLAINGLSEREQVLLFENLKIYLQGQNLI